MTEKNKVIWSEGMFLLPQHFQQHDRYLENLINARCMGLRAYNWGFYSLMLDNDLLKLGKLALSECAGIFPDGTPFNLPEDDALPLPLDIPEDVHNELVFLALPVRRRDGVEVDSDEYQDALARFRVGDQDVKDHNCGTENKATLQCGRLKTQLLMEQHERSGYTCLGVARIVDTQPDKSIMLDDQYLPPNLNCLAVTKLREFLQRLQGSLHARGEAIVDRVTNPGYSGVAEITDWLLLQLINRYQPLFEHLSNVVGLHPDTFYRFAIQLAGELATFLRKERRPISLPRYDHDDLQATFSPLMKEIEYLLGTILVPRARQIPLNKLKYGVYAAMSSEFILLQDAVFVLAAKAQMAAEKLRGDFPPNVKIGPGEDIGKLVNQQLPGIPIQAMAVAPRQIPFHAGFTYFEISKHSELWKRMKSSSVLAIHIGGNFPGLELELWSIKED
jgi:type VI secretion system protein ImpJ